MAPAEILIVQDDFLAAERLRLLLVEAGYKVVGLASRTAGADRSPSSTIRIWRSST